MYSMTTNQESVSHATSKPNVIRSFRSLANLLRMESPIKPSASTAPLTGYATITTDTARELETRVLNAAMRCALLFQSREVVGRVRSWTGSG